MVNNSSLATIFVKQISTLLFFIILLTSCQNIGFSKLKSTANDFQYLLKSINCNDNVEYWELNYVFDKQETIFQLGDLKLKDKIVRCDGQKGFFPGCHPLFCNYHIVYFKKGLQYNVTTRDSLKLFIGHIDNKEEAFLIALINDYNIDWDHWQGRSYQETKGGYLLKVSKIDYCPEKRESFLVFVDKDGSLTIVKSLGIYYQTKLCITS
jgi:hypothetical protein